MSKIKIICVYNNQEIFDKVVKNNENYKDCEIFAYDNRIENVSITKRYNSFINENILGAKKHSTKNDVMLNSFQHRTDERPCDPETSSGRRGEVFFSPQKENLDFWCLFLHQDFGIKEDINKIIEKLNPAYIYGAVGIKIFKGIFYGKKNAQGHLGFKNELFLTFGKIMQGNNDFNFKKHGRKVFFPLTVDAIDCCCILMHSSLLKKHALRFDENLNFHMYAEELCYSAKMNHKIKTKVTQMNCFHLGKGVLNEDYEKAREYLKNKFKIKRIPSTCPG